MKSVWKMRYQIIEKLGQGANGSVYKVKDMHLEKEWAMKFLEERRKSAVEGMEEWKILSRISHTNFPRIVDTFEEDGLRIIVMDFITGVTLEEVIKKGFMEEKQMITIAKQICEAIHYLHMQTPVLLYLDLKPANIMIEENGCVKLVDLGSVSVKGNGEMVSGTFGYASPEQIRGDNKENILSEQSDIFSFGMVLYAMLTGNCMRIPVIELTSKRGAFAGEKNPKISPKVEKIIEKCTRGIPQRRYYSMREVKSELDIWEKKWTKGYRGTWRLKKKDRQWYQEKSILCTEGRHSFYIARRLMVLLLLLTAIFMPTKKLDVVLRDHQMRKVLVRNGCAYETKTNLLFEIPWEEIDGDNCTIIVECKDRSLVKKRFYIDCILAN